MLTFLAAFPILLLLILMTVFRWSGTRSGILSWLAALILAFIFFGLTPEVLAVSQLKGLIFSVYVLGVLWPALMLYHLNNETGGIAALTSWLNTQIADRALLVILIAWTFTGILEGIAGFGLPIAVAAPMMVSLGIPALLSVSAAAIGNAWSVTFGNMGMVFQTLVSLSGYTESQIVPFAAAMMGIACLLCGLSVAFILGEMRHWRVIVIIAVIMSLAQYLIAAGGLLPLSGFGASLLGLISGILLSRKTRPEGVTVPLSKAFKATLASYSILAIITLVIFMDGPIHRFLFPFFWRMDFPEVTTLTGMITPAGPGQIFRWFSYPGTIILVGILISQYLFFRVKVGDGESFKAAFQKTYRTAIPVTLGIIATVGLSVMMDHAGMTQLLAETLSHATGKLFPVISPIIGMVGAFATGSNANSNVLFVSLQKQIAGMISVFPVILIASQTAGGSLGSMIAPSKLIVGCSNVGLVGKEGQVLRKTLPFGLAIGLLIGFVGWILTTFIR